MERWLSEQKNHLPAPRLAASFQVMAAGAAGSVSAVLMGWLWDRFHSVGVSFAVPLIGFVVTAIYGFLYPGLLEKSRRAT